MIISAKDLSCDSVQTVQAVQTVHPEHPHGDIHPGFAGFFCDVHRDWAIFPRLMASDRRLGHLIKFSAG